MMLRSAFLKLIKDKIGRLLCMCLGILWVISAHATHNRSGEITYQQIDALTIRATITTYTKASADAIDRDSLELFWGDGTSQWILRDNGQGEEVGNNVKINYYSATHTYPGTGTYTMSLNDRNRVANILNVNWPNSVNVPFYVETTFTFLNDQFQGFNSSAILLQAPIDFACTGERFVHNPNAYDPDGDSLAFEFITPRQSVEEVVPGYIFPDQIAPGPGNKMTLDPITGELLWEAPATAGEYNIALLIKEYREGVLINATTRDMQIFVSNCMNKPPTVEVIPEICVIAGELIDINVAVSDPDSNQLVALTATGGPLVVEDSPAELIVDEEFQPSVLTGKFRWQTTCNHVSDEYYQVVFRGVDNQIEGQALADLKTLRIKIVAPPPENLSAKSDRESIKLTWDFPYDCQVTDNEYFLGFSIWRKIGSKTLQSDSCTTGLENSGYEKIIFITNQHDGTQYFETDSLVENGRTYCYRILAEFARRTQTGNVFNKVQSIPSNEVCLQISRDLPMLTKVSVHHSLPAPLGKMNIEWIKPDPDDLDTLLHPGPYRYQIERAMGINGNEFEELIVSDANIITQFFDEPAEFNAFDTGLNTEDFGYNYRIAFYTNGQLYGYSATASSIYINVSSTDRASNIQIDLDVPWSNTSYTLFRSDAATLVFDSIADFTSLSYTDTGLENDVKYCYFVRSTGTYGIENTPSPLINNSQVQCVTPQDSLPPCVPSLSVHNQCEDSTDETPSDEFFNTIRWDLLSSECMESDDIAKFRLFYSKNDDDILEQIAEIDINEDFLFEHQPEQNIAGCYQIQAIDQQGNVSELSEKICTHSCPVFELPNIFTPNDDGSHDRLIPRKSRFVSQISLKIFNRWGQLVFETNNPNIDWDGKSTSGKDLADGVYFYTCAVFEQNIEGNSQLGSTLKGTIEILR